MDSIITYSDCKKTIKRRTESSCVFPPCGKVRNGGKRQYTELLYTKQQVKKTCSLCFANKFKLQENNFKIVQKNF